MIEPVHDPADPRLDDYRSVPDPQLLRRRGLFVAEGRLVVRMLLQEGGFRCRSLLVTPTALASLADLLQKLSEPPLVYVVPQALMNTIGGFNFHRGCLGLGERPAAIAGASSVLRPGARLAVALERVGNADNVGAAFRNAAAFGADAVLLGPGCCDPLYRKAIRTSMGATLRLPFGVCAAWPGDLSDLRAAGWTVVALTPRADAVDIGTLAGERPPRILLLLGAEGSGLSDAALAVADVRARIPMEAGVDSLNVATALGIALFVLRRRTSSDPLSQ